MPKSLILCADYLTKDRLYRVYLACAPNRAIAFEDDLEEVAKYAREKGYLLVVF